MKSGVKSAREKQVPVKNPKKLPKMAFTGTFEFHGEEKKTPDWKGGLARHEQ